MKTKIAVLSVLLFVCFSCKQENTFTDYKFADKPDLVCDDIKQKLYKEALYSFEDDILKFYGKGNPNASLVQAYAQFISNSNYGNLKFTDIISKHSLKIFEALKHEDDLWDPNNTKSHLNYHSKIMGCISKNIQDKNLSTTLNSLISTNFMAPKLFSRPLINRYRNTLNDKYLATYVALDLYYAKLFDVDVSTINFDKPEPLDFNVIPAKPNTQNQ